MVLSTLEENQLQSALIYQYEIDATDDSTASRIIRLVGREKRVLELGCATGSMSAVLSRQNACDVTGVEIDPDAAALARPHLARLVVGDLDRMEWRSVVEHDQFEVIIAADVLEHLREPGRCLKNIAEHLSTSSGFLVISLPNIAHLAVISGLLCGEFPYAETGLLDKTHLRFFTPRGAARLIAQCGLTIEHAEFVSAGPPPHISAVVCESLSPVSDRYNSASNSTA